MEFIPIVFQFKIRCLIGCCWDTGVPANASLIHSPIFAPPRSYPLLMRLSSCLGLILLLPVFGLLASCSEDFEVAAPYKPVTIAYGLLNVGDTAQYFRIQKAFLDENKSALDMAQVADSNFYSALEVHLRELNNGVIIADELLPRVDLNQEGYPKDSGVFFNTPSYAYKSKRSLNPAYTYRLVIINHSTGQVDSAETHVIPNNFRVDEFMFGYQLSFPAVSDRNNFSITVAVPTDAQRFEGYIRFHYVDKVVATGVQTDRTLDWNFATTDATPGKASVVLTVPQRTLYSALHSSIPDAAPGVERYIDTAEVFVWTGSSEYALFNRINAASGGLTADQIRPLYTNFKGSDIYGLFASRAVRYYWAPFNDVTIDSLMNNSSTRSLNFKGRSDH